MTLHPEPDVDLQVSLPFPALLGNMRQFFLLTNAASAPHRLRRAQGEMTAEIKRAADARNVVLALTPRAVAAGNGGDEGGDSWGVLSMSELRAELVGKTLMGMPIDDTVCTLKLQRHDFGRWCKKHTATSEQAFWVGAVACCCARSPVVAHGDRPFNRWSSYRSFGGSADAGWCSGRYVAGVLQQHGLPDLVKALGSWGDCLMIPLNGTDDLSGHP